MLGQLLSPPKNPQTLPAIIEFDVVFLEEKLEGGVLIPV
jgi:hypothetical protein